MRKNKDDGRRGEEPLFFFYRIFQQKKTALKVWRFFMKKKGQMIAVLILLAMIGVIAYRHSTGKDLEKYEVSFFDVFDTQTQIIGYA